MREIKFRAWDNDDKEMNYMVEHEGLDTFFAHNDMMTYLQYTGLKDKNGKEIYEGDIIKGIVAMKDKHGEDISTVRWDYPKLGFSFSGLFIFNFELGNKGYNVEVIGNIYENPELLKE